MAFARWRVARLFHEQNGMGSASETTCFPNPGFSELRRLILFALQATARGGFRNPQETEWHLSGLRVNQALRATDSATCEAISLARHVVSLTYVRRAT
jgi:hypothetical protein